MKFWKSAVGRYLMSLLIWIDQGGNVIFSPIMTRTVGDPDETISSRLGKMKRKHGGVIPWYHPISGVVDWGLDKIDPGHSIDAIEEDEGVTLTDAFKRQVAKEIKKNSGIILPRTRENKDE